LCSVTDARYLYYKNNIIHSRCATNRTYTISGLNFWRLLMLYCYSTRVYTILYNNNMFRHWWRFIAVEWACFGKKILTASCRNDNIIGWAIEFRSRLYDAIAKRTPVAWQNGWILILGLFSFFFFLFLLFNVHRCGRLYDNAVSKLLR